MNYRVNEGRTVGSYGPGDIIPDGVLTDPQRLIDAGFIAPENGEAPPEKKDDEKDALRAELDDLRGFADRVKAHVATLPQAQQERFRKAVNGEEDEKEG